MAEMEMMHTYPATNAKGNLGVTLGAIGTGLGLLGNGINLMGGMRNAPAQCDQYVTRHELEMAQAVAAKDSEIALLKSEQNTEIKIADVYERVMTRVNADQRAQAEINAAQAVYNGTNGATLACMKSAIEQLQSLTKVVVPNSSVCPGWGDVTVTPA